MTPKEIVDSLVDDCILLAKEIMKKYKIEENEKRRISLKAQRHIRKLSLRTLEREAKRCG